MSCPSKLSGFKQERSPYCVLWSEPGVAFRLGSWLRISQEAAVKLPMGLPSEAYEGRSSNWAQVLVVAWLSSYHMVLFA